MHFVGVTLMNKNHQCFTYQVKTYCCVPMACLYWTNRQVMCVDGQYNLVCRVVKYTSHVNAIRTTKQTSEKGT